MSRKIKRENGLNVLSLFDGMSCGQIGLEQSKIKVNTYIASEIEKAAIKLTLSKYPNTLMVGDVTKLHYSRGKLYANCKRKIVDSLANYQDKLFWSDDELMNFKKRRCQILANGDVIRFIYNKDNVVFEGKIDLLLGGSPCTQFSSASFFTNGKENYGLKGKDSSLFYEYYRIMQEVKPKYFLLENVDMKEESAQLLNEYMKKHYILINSNLVSYQNRPRLYWTNIPNIKHPKDLGIDFQNYKLSTIPRVEKLLYEQRFLGSTSPINLTSNEVETIYNNNKWAFEQIKAIHPALTKEEFVNELHQMLKEACCKKIPSHDKMIYGNANGKFKCKDVTNASKVSCLSTRQDRCPNSGYVIFHDYIRLLTRLELAQAQTISYSYVYDMSYSELQRVLGNGWTVDVIVHILKQLKKQYDFS